MAYERVAGPIGGAREDYLAALISSAVVNVNRGKASPIPLEEFVPQWDGKRERTPDDLWQIARQINAQLGGTEVQAGG